MTWSSYHSHIPCQGDKVNEMRPQIKSEGLSIPAEGNFWYELMGMAQSIAKRAVGSKQ